MRNLSLKNIVLVTVLFLVFITAATSETQKTSTANADNNQESAKQTNSDPQKSTAESTPEEETPSEESTKNDKKDVTMMPAAEGNKPFVCADQQEMATLLSLRKRREDLDERERYLNEREKIILKEETKIQQRISDALEKIAALETKITGLYEADVEPSAKEQRLTILIEALQSLSAKKAAPLFEKLEQRLAVDLLTRLGSVKTGAMLAKMEPDKAAAFVAALAKASKNQHERAKITNQSEGKKP